MRAALGNRTPDLRITRVFSSVARGFKARAGFMFAGCCWRRSLAVDGSSGTSRGHASAAQSSQEHWPRPSAHTWLRLSPLETGCTGNTCRVRAGRRVVEKQGRRAHRRGVRGGSPGVDSSPGVRRPGARRLPVLARPRHPYLSHSRTVAALALPGPSLSLRPRRTQMKVEPSAWEAERCDLSTGATCAGRFPRVTVRDRPSPGLMAR